MPSDTVEKHHHYQPIADAIYYYVDKQYFQPSLTEVADRVNLSPSHFQRIFSRWAGISPTQFLQYLTKESAKNRLLQSTVLDAALSAGLSSQSRLYDLMLQWEGVTPGEFRRRGSDISFYYGWHDSPLGLCFIAWGEKGVTKLSFLPEEDASAAAYSELQSDWPAARLVLNQELAELQISQIFSHWYQESCVSSARDKVSPLRLFVKGTAFQLRVWQALLAIQPGHCWSYSGVASSLGIPSASRAVASAIAKNPIGYLIPCHRVIRQTGAFHQYRWGEQRKALLLGWEAARHSADSLA